MAPPMPSARAVASPLARRRASRVLVELDVNGVVSGDPASKRLADRAGESRRASRSPALRRFEVPAEPRRQVVEEVGMALGAARRRRPSPGSPWPTRAATSSTSIACMYPRARPRGSSRRSSSDGCARAARRPRGARRPLRAAPRQRGAPVAGIHGALRWNCRRSEIVRSTGSRRRVIVVEITAEQLARDVRQVAGVRADLGADAQAAGRAGSVSTGDNGRRPFAVVLHVEPPYG